MSQTRWSSPPIETSGAGALPSSSLSSATAVADDPEPILFSRPYRASAELSNLTTVLGSDHAHGDGPFTTSATARLSRITGAENVLLTTSCTHALEMASLLLELKPGDEVILPSFTFPSAADAIVLRGATPVFVDIDMASGNIDPDAVEAAITGATKAIYVVHYGGVAADMEALGVIAAEHGLPVVEDNAHGLGGTYQGRQLGTIGVIGTQSFHDTKNVHCGEGGAILVNDPAFMEPAEIIREKGTDRSKFLRGQVDKYTWVGAGSSYLPSEFNAAVLDAQLAEFEQIQTWRNRIWNAYAFGLATWAAEEGIELMRVGEDREHTAHLFYLLMPDHDAQRSFMAHMRAHGISTPFHYIPLDSAPAGRRYGRTPVPCTRSEDFSRRLVRLPIWAGMPDAQMDRVVETARRYRVAD